MNLVLLLGGSLACRFGISTWSPPKSLAWQMGFRLGSGLTLRRLGLWLLVCDRHPPVRGVGVLLVGHRRDFMVVCPLAVAAVLSCKVQADWWVAPHLAVRTLFDCCRWTCQVTRPVQRTPLWPASWLPAVDKSWGFQVG